MATESDYSPEGRAARDLFVSEFTNYIFYVEDSDSEVFYERFIEKVLPGINGFEVVCLNGKSNVERKVHEKRVNGLSYVFIVDKDFDDLLGPPLHEELVYLDRYCIENYLAELKPLVNVLVEEFPELTSAQRIVAACDDYEEYRGRLEQRLKDVTRYFVISQKRWLNIQTSKTPLAELIQGGNEYHPMPTDEWMEDYRRKLLEESGLTNDDLKLELEQALVPSPEFPGGTVNELWHVPGKLLLHCLLKYLSIRIKPEFEKKLGRSLYVRILNHVQATEFQRVKDRLVSRHPNLGAFG